MNLSRILLSIVLVGLAGCDAAPPQKPAAAESPAAACAAQGGAIRKVCRMQTERCVVPYADAGKECTDKSQCQGRCILDGDRPAQVGEAARGRCEVDNDPCGCKLEVKGGKYAGGICVD